MPKWADAIIKEGLEKNPNDLREFIEDTTEHLMIVLNKLMEKYNQYGNGMLKMRKMKS